MGNLAIEAKGLTKAYAIGQYRGARSLRESLGNLFRSRHAHGPAPEAAAAGTFLALDDVSFAVGHGEVVGLIGANGAGKSTLLKILSRVTRPNRGEARIWGRVGSLLEVGTGFHPELSGHENIYFNAALLGMGRRDVRRRYDEIVAFSGVERFLHMPVKHYSSGMHIRLAFSVAVHVDPDILFLDEVLAVGDAEFQRKSYEKLKSLIGDGRTVIVVSHSGSSIRSLCSRALYLQQGRLIADGDVREVQREYASDIHDAMTAQASVAHEAPATVEAAPPARAGGQPGSEDASPAPGKRPQSPNFIPNSRVARLREVRIVQAGRTTAAVDIDKDFFVEIEYDIHEARKLNLSIQLLDAEGSPFLTSPNYVSACIDEGEAIGQPVAPGRYTSRCRIPGNFLNDGVFSVHVYIITDNINLEVEEFDCASFKVIDTGAMRAEYDGPWAGVSIRPILGWGTFRMPRPEADGAP